MRHTITPLLVVGTLVLGGCAGSHGPTATSRTSTSRGRPATTPAPTALPVPDTLPDGAFPAVDDPERDGSLSTVRLRAVTVATATAPTALVPRPGHDDQAFLAERAGTVHLVTIDTDGTFTIDPEPLLDISSRVSTEGERGLLGLAVSPDGDTLYVSSNLPDGDSRVEAAPVTGDRVPRVGEPSTLFEVDQMGTAFHKGGDLAVDADGLLYASFGDGGPQGDAEQHAQDPSLLLGKILRIDPTRRDGDRPYTIPTDNPHARGGGAPEIWLTGLRNPWRFALDEAGGDIWIGDVGQDEVEEIDRLPMAAVHGGANLGWSGHEGTTVFAAERIVPGSIPPIFEMHHSTGVCSVTGGLVYRGAAVPALDGVYVFADLCAPGIHGIRATTPTDGVGRVVDERILAGTEDVAQTIAFATDGRDRLYTLSLDGTIRRLESTDRR